MADVAQLGLAVDSSQVKTATSNLNKMTEASKNAEKAATDLAKAGGGNAGGMSKQLEDSAKSADKLANTLAATRNANQGLTTSLGASRGAILAAAEAFGALSVGALAFGAGALIVSEKWGAGQREIERALIGIGQRTGETLQSLTKFSNDNASLTGLSLTEARNAALELTKTGNVAVSSLTGLGDAIHGYAVLTGTDATDATKTFAKALSGDLVKGAEQLNQSYGTMNSSTLSLIRALEIQGNRTAAVQVILDSMRESNLKAADSVSVLGKAYEGLKNVMDRVLNGPTKSASLDDGLADRQLAALQKQRDAILALPGNMTGGGSKVLDDLNQQIDTLQQKVSGFSAEQISKQLNGLSEAGDNVVRSVIPQIDQINKLEESLKQLEAARDTPGVDRSLGAGTDDAAAQAIQNQIAGLQQAQAEAAAYNQNIANLAISWGVVSQSTALALQQLQNQLPVVQAITGAEQIQAQQQATINNLKLQGKSLDDASLIASLQRQVAEEGATAAVMRQVDALKDSTELIEAALTGDEARTAAAIAYKNAIDAGADSTAAAALESATFDNATARAAASLRDAASSTANISSNMQDAAVAVDYMQNNVDVPSNAAGPDPNYDRYIAAYRARPTFEPIVMPKSGGEIPTDPNNPLYAMGGIFYRGGGGGRRLDTGAGIAAFNSPSITTPGSASEVLSWAASEAYAAGGIDASIQAVMDRGMQYTRDSDISAVLSQVGSLFDFKNSMTGDKAAQASNLNAEIALLSSLPESIARDQKISDLQKSIDQLRDSTDGLNRTNQELLSPYYSQDPRTSHIGFRSQGMASGGYVDVPGVPSANDNMTAIIPVASGERIYVDPMPSKRGGIGSQTVVSITNNISVAAGAQRNEVGRTVYQATQNALKQFQAASR